MRHTVLLIATALSTFAATLKAEKIHTLENEGKVTCENGGNFSALIYYVPATTKKNTFSYQFQINSNISRLEDKTTQSYVCFLYDSTKSSIYLSSGENEIKGSSESSLDIIAWDEPGTDMTTFIDTYIATYNLQKDYDSSQFAKTVSEILTLKDILRGRITFLKDNVDNSEKNLEKLKGILETTKEQLVALKEEKTSTETTVEEEKKVIQDLNTQIIAKEDELKANPDDALLQLQLKDLQDQQHEKVVHVQALNNRVYEIEKQIPDMEELIAKLEQDITAWPDTIENYRRELTTRENDLARLNALDLSTNSTTQAPVYVTYNESSTTVKKDDGYNFGEVFGISCISSCGIALPVAVVYSTAYTEFRLPEKKKGPEFESDNPPSTQNSNINTEEE